VRHLFRIDNAQLKVFTVKKPRQVLNNCGCVPSSFGAAKSQMIKSFTDEALSAGAQGRIGRSPALQNSVLS
jgi:hypothetical protein